MPNRDFPKETPTSRDPNPGAYHQLPGCNSPGWCQSLHQTLGKIQHQSHPMDSCKVTLPQFFKRAVVGYHLKLCSKKLSKTQEWHFFRRLEHPFEAISPGRSWNTMRTWVGNLATKNSWISEPFSVDDCHVGFNTTIWNDPLVQVVMTHSIHESKNF